MSKTLSHDAPSDTDLDTNAIQVVSAIKTVEPAQNGKRLDQAAAELFPEYSRGQLQKWIKSGELTLDGASMKPKSSVIPGQSIRIEAELQQVQDWHAQEIELAVNYEDEEIIVIDKPAGLVVHPAAGNADGTLANAILAHCPNNGSLPRAGIVHRLDKDTTGLMVVAKTLTAHASLVDQLQSRTVSRQYRAVVCGRVIAGGSIDKPIGRHPTQRIKMAVRPEQDANAKPAKTHYRIAEKFAHHTELSVKLETGRTHQIRVHMASLGFPLLGDPVYLGKYKRPAGISDEQSEVLAAFRRQALHAERLAFTHPKTNETVSFESPPPKDYIGVTTLLRQTNS